MKLLILLSVLAASAIASQKRYDGYTLIRLSKYLFNLQMFKMSFVFSSQVPIVPGNAKGSVLIRGYGPALRAE
jgi:hypothetical protein